MDSELKQWDELSDEAFHNFEQSMDSLGETVASTANKMGTLADLMEFLNRSPQFRLHMKIQELKYQFEKRLQYFYLPKQLYLRLIYWVRYRDQ